MKLVNLAVLYYNFDVILNLLLGDPRRPLQAYPTERYVQCQCSEGQAIPWIRSQGSLSASSRVFPTGLQTCDGGVWLISELLSFLSLCFPEGARCLNPCVTFSNFYSCYCLSLNLVFIFSVQGEAYSDPVKERRAYNAKKKALNKVCLLYSLI